MRPLRGPPGRLSQIAEARLLCGALLASGGLGLGSATAVGYVSRSVPVPVAVVAGPGLSPSNEYRSPSGAHSRHPPLGAVIVIHGGGWQIVGHAAVVAARPQASFFRAQGWATYNVDYRAGRLSLTDILAAYDALRHQLGPKAAVCAWGGSSGGHLALLLAAYRPAVKCVMAAAAPTDLVSYDREPAYAPLGVPRSTGPTWLYTNYILPTFGLANLWQWSPVRVASRILAQVLLGESSYDELVPQEQMWDMQRLRPDTTRAMLLPGSWLSPENFVHASVTRSALASWQRAELQLLATVGSHGVR
jgi:acetyl esterase/lipase